MTPILAASSWESLLVFLGFILISAFTNWLKKRREEQQQAQQQQQPQPPAGMPSVPGPGRTEQPQPRRASWEDELRRLLEGDESTPPAAPPPAPAPAPPPFVPAAPPPLPSRQTRPAHPPPLVVASPVALGRPSTVSDEGGVPTPRLSKVRLPRQLDEISVEQPADLEAWTRPMDLAPLAQSAAAIRRGTQVADRVSKRFETAHATVALHTTSLSLTASSELSNLVAALRQQGGARHAFVYSVILGPPKAFGDY
jgi:hypothetical protein